MIIEEHIDKCPDTRQIEFTLDTQRNGRLTLDANNETVQIIQMAIVKNTPIRCAVLFATVRHLHLFS